MFLDIFDGLSLMTALLCVSSGSYAIFRVARAYAHYVADVRRRGIALDEVALLLATSFASYMMTVALA